MPTRKLDKNIYQLQWESTNIYANCIHEFITGIRLAIVSTEIIAASAY